MLYQNVTVKFPTARSFVGPQGLSNPFAGLRRRHYSAILADPGWRHATYSAKGQGRSPKYRTDSVADIALPVAEIAAADCRLFVDDVAASGAGDCADFGLGLSLQLNCVRLAGAQEIRVNLPLVQRARLARERPSRFG